MGYNPSSTRRIILWEQHPICYYAAKGHTLHPMIPLSADAFLSPIPRTFGLRYRANGAAVAG